MSRIVIQDRFSPQARALRAHFDERFADPRGADSGRFVWDYWHVPGQYTVLRTPAYHFFPPALYRRFHEQLVLWGRKNLGCHDVSPPWLSVYVDGCRQELHGDLPHGPWAFVYSLTPWEKRKFRGGETLLVRDEILRFWESRPRGGLEEESILEKIEPRFNRLTVFDPRVPHGVRRVENVWDPREGRLVIHGWFVQPRPFIEGPLRRPALAKAIEAVSESLAPLLDSGIELSGLLSMSFRVGTDGRVGAVKALSNTLVAPGDATAETVRAVTGALRVYRFDRQRAPSRVTLPLVFES